MEQLTPAIWLIVLALGGVALGAGLAYGMRQTGHKPRDTRIEKESRAATRRLFHKD